MKPLLESMMETISVLEDKIKRLEDMLSTRPRPERATPEESEFRGNMYGMLYGYKESLALLKGRKEGE